MTQELTSTEAARHDVATTMRNALKLGFSLVVTLGIGFGVRIALRRYLGPAVIGPVNFADAFTTTAFIFLSLGIDTHVRRVVPVNATGANEFLGTVFVIRGMLAATVFVVMAAVLEWMQLPAEVRELVWAYGAAQLCLSFNNTCAALLQSSRTIDGLSALNVVCKLIWAAGFIATMVFEWPLLGIPLSVLLAELIRLPISYYLVRKHVKLELRVDWKKIYPVLRSSLPFYVNAVALVVVNRFDVNVLKVRSNDTEIGLYSAAAELAQMTFVMVPMLSGVVMPLFARMQARSVNEYREVVRRTLELVLVLAFPPSLAIAVGADVWVGLVLGEQYAASAWALSILGPTFLLTYTAVVISQTLNLGGEAWTVTLTSLMSMFVHPLLVMVLVDTANGWGAGGAGAACAIAAVASETLVLTIMLWRIGGWVVDKRLLTMITKTLLACAVVMTVDRFFLHDLGPGRVLIDGIMYVILVLGSGAVKVGDTINLVRTMRAQRAGLGAAPPIGS